MDILFSKHHEASSLQKQLVAVVVFLFLGISALWAQAPTTPTVNGNVFGGGRMANVNNAAAGTTATIDIYSSTIDGGVFGGNDITGQVASGSDPADASAQITIHDNCDAATSVGEVYGGANGYYEYVIDGVTISAATEPSLDMTTAVPAETTVSVYKPGDAHDDAHLVASFTTTAATTYAGLLPSLNNTSVVIGEPTDPENNIALGEVYGGAKNAYVNGTSSVTVESGTIGKVFAGNNYGGSTASSELTINGTSGPATATAFADIDWSQVGDWQNGGFGIGEAYGGGNAVDVLTGAGATVNGGYVKTLFGGNNLADMTAVPVVNLNGGNINTAYGGGNAGSMVGMKAGRLDVSQYISNDLFTKYPSPVPAFLSNSHFLYFYGAETLVEQKPDKHLYINTIYGGCRAANVNMGTYTRITNADYVGTVFGGCDISGSVAANPGGLEYTAAEMDIEYYNFTTGDGHALDITPLPAGFPIMNLSSMVTITGSRVDSSMFAGGNGDYNYVESGDVVNVYPFGADQTPENLLATIAKTDYYRPWVANATTAMEGGALGGNLYGGGNNATVGRPAVGDEPAVEGRSYVLLGKTQRGILAPETTGPKIEGEVYAGGKKSDVYGTVDVLVKAGCDISKLYAGNDISGLVTGTNRSNFTNNPETTISTTLLGGTNAYCGEPLHAPFGNESNKVQVYVRVEGAHNDVDGVAREAAKIDELFGGGNGAYDYVNDYPGLDKPSQHSCWLDIQGEVGTSYGGGNAADIEYSNTYITADAKVETAFAGGNSATVTTSANLWLNCNATYGTQAYVDGSDPAKTPNVVTIFGGNNIADMNIVPRINLMQGAVGTVYGGGNKGDMKGYEPASVDLHEYINNNSFDAFNDRLTAMGKALSTPLSAENFIFFYSTGVVVNGENLAVGTLYGGCKAANVDLSSYVRMQKAAYIGDIYGGCDIAGTVGKKGNCKADGTGADGTSALTDHPTSAMRFAGIGAPGANAQGVVTIDIPAGFPMVNTASYVRILAGKVDGNVYGGGNGAYDYTSPGYSEYATNLPNVFAVGVSLEGGQLQQNLYGGGNKADVGRAGASGNNYVVLGKTHFGTNYESNPGPKVLGTVYAGGKMADVYGIVDVLVKENTYVERLFAGNDISGSVQGNARATSTISSAFPDDWSTALVGGTNAYNGTDLKNFDGNGGSIQVYVRVEEDAEIKTLFGGGNGEYDYTSGPYAGLSKPEQSSCWLDIKGNVKTSYGGGNAANVAVSNTYITGDAAIETAFAGGNSATVTEAANLWLNCDDTRAAASFVNYTHDEVAADPAKRPNVFTIYGGNNIADMYIVPKVELDKGSVNTVYGGGKKGAMRGYRGIVFDVTGFVNPVVLRPMSDLGMNMNTHNYPDLVGTLLYVNGTDEKLFINKIYGGCMAADVDYSTYVHVNNVEYLNTIYGGCDIAGAVGTQSLITPTSDIHFAFVDGMHSDAFIPAGMNYPATGSADVVITGGKINGKIFGGGNGEYTYDGNDVKDAGGNLLVTLDPGAQMPWVNSYNMLLQGGDIQGTVYGGGNKATVGKDNGAGSYTVMPSYLFVGKSDGSELDLSNASIFAGGRMAAVYGPVDVMVKQGATINTVYAGNDISGSVEGAGRGDFPSTFSEGFGTALYHYKDADGSRGLYNSYNNTSLTNYDGAGNDIQIYVRTEAGSTINTLFGGGNGAYNYTAGDYAGLEKPAQSSTWLDIAGDVTTAYGGGNAANIDRSNLCVIGSATVGTVYGGCKAADVTHSSHVYVDECAIDHSTPHITGNVFGGCDISGNVGLSIPGRYDISSHSESIGHARVQILAGQVDGRVFGGGNGLQDAAGNSYGTNALSSGSVAGGDDVYAYNSGTYNGKTLPMVENTWVTIDGATIGTTPGSSTHTVFGGGQGAGTRVIHNVDLEVGKTAATTINGICYGGSYAGFVNTDCGDHTRTLLTSNVTLNGDVYGGSYGNYVRGKINLVLDNPAISGSIFGGNNNAAQPECDAEILANIDNCDAKIFGGGNEADFYGTTRITFTQGKVGYIFGGGNNAHVYGNTIVEVLGGTVCHDVYGGGQNGGVYAYKSEGSPSAFDTYPTSPAWGGNTTVIIRSDCLQYADGDFVTASGVKQPNRGDTKYYAGNDPSAVAKDFNVLSPSSYGLGANQVIIRGNVFGGSWGADPAKVEGAKVVGNTFVHVFGNVKLGYYGEEDNGAYEKDGNVYGGGNAGKVEGDTKVIIGEND